MTRVGVLDREVDMALGRACRILRTFIQALSAQVPFRRRSRRRRSVLLSMARPPIMSLTKRDATIDGRQAMTSYHAGRLDEFNDGGRRVVSCGGTEIGIFMVDGELYAWHNECAHRGGPVCQGRIMKRVVEPVQSDGTVRTLRYHAGDTHIVCPWHGYEYNIKTGEHPAHSALKLRKAMVTVRDGEVYVVPG